MKIHAAFIGEDAVIKVSEDVFKNRTESDQIKVAFQKRFQRKIHIVLIAWNQLGNDWNYAGPPDLIELARNFPIKRLSWKDYEI